MVQAIDYALLIGEMESVLAKLKTFGSVSDVESVEEMKKRYYKQYLNLLREERE